ncbi:ABC transporter ATP-binding protein, partial [Streptosporangium sp. NPDC048865]|uniref:ABC transporter ATP-binding protein n=1 Tax=Streptosporangium sp. NPDC048865 TaxID=3155766 RepID=UPI003447488F
MLEVRDLDVTFGSGPGAVRAVRGVGYTLRPGEVLGVVGESGSGKSVTSLAVMGLLPAHARVTGSVRLLGREILGAPERTLTAFRGKTVSMVFQDPLSALTPVYRVGDQIAEAIRVHRRVSAGQAARRAVELLDLVGIPNAAQRARAFPHEFSGGMRQRAVIAMAIANDPDVILCDEPTTALDVTIQAQVLEVLKTAQRETGAAIVLITHDLGVVAGFADRVLVMYAGRPVEVGSVDEVFYRSRMPYTMGLLGSIPRLDRGREQPLVPIVGSPPSPAALPPGCPFEPRCPIAVPECAEAEPEPEPVGSPGHLAACIRSGEIEEAGWSPARLYGVRGPAAGPVAPAGSAAPAAPA